MRPALVLLACWWLPLTGAAHAAGDAQAPSVIGGATASAGKWPDVAAILFPEITGDEPRCTGTLIAPTLVLTAGHCYDPGTFSLPDHVLIGASSLARPGDGETIAIARGFAYPDAATSKDVAVLVLARPSRRAPRALATGWARLGIVNGATVEVVGFGAINATGDEYVNELQEAQTTITDFDCSSSVGCHAAARPAGELGAGGMGVDTCPGDSGGPLYLTTSHGAWLAGVTSRSYDDAQLACSDGGIYERADQVIDWIEATTGVTVAHGPEPTAGTIAAVHGEGGDTRIRVNDPESDRHRFEITTPPAHGTANVRDDGELRVCTDAAAAPGDDEVTVTIIDSRRDGRALPITVKIKIEAGSPPPVACDLNAFDSAGCCDTRRGGSGAVPLALAVLAVARRRRRRA